MTAQKEDIRAPSCDRIRMLVQLLDKARPLAGNVDRQLYHDRSFPVNASVLGMIDVHRVQLACEMNQVRTLLVKE